MVDSPLFALTQPACEPGSARAACQQEQGRRFRYDCCITALIVNSRLTARGPRREDQGCGDEQHRFDIVHRGSPPPYGGLVIDTCCVRIRGKT